MSEKASASATAGDPAERAAGAIDAPAVDDLSFEQARDELVRVVAELEQGSPTLEQSLALWERGEALAARCDAWLLGAKRRLEATKPEAAKPEAAHVAAADADEDA